jgi:CheY-like chemotaxis protein
MFNILLIEDNEDDAFMLGMAFDREGLKGKVHWVANGDQAKQYLLGTGRFADRGESPFPSIIFTDLKMPGMDGFDILKWLKTDPAWQIIPTTVISSSIQEEDVEKAYRLGANAYLRKPNSLGELQKQMRAVYEFWMRCAKVRAFRN